MNDYITQEEYDDVEDLVIKAIHANSKAGTEPYIKQLSFKKSHFCGTTATIYSQLVASVKSVAGRVADKDRRMIAVEQELHKLSWHIKE